jgi:hypothetical protein
MPCAEGEARRTRRVPCEGFRARIEFPEALNRRGEGSILAVNLHPLHSAQATLSRMSAGLIEYYEHASQDQQLTTPKRNALPPYTKTRAPHPDSLNPPQKTPQYS